MCFEDFKATARLVYKLYMTEALIKSDLHTARCQQGLQECINITEYYKTVTNYSCTRLINDETAKKKKKDQAEK